MKKKKSLVGWGQLDYIKLKFDRRFRNQDKLIILGEITRGKTECLDKELRITIEEL